MNQLRDPDLVSLEEAAPMLGVGRTTAYLLARKGEFPGALKVGNRWKVSVPKFRRIVHGDTATATA